MTDLKLVGLCGSLRQESANNKLMLEAARVFAPGSFISGDLRLPLFDNDVQQNEGIPDSVQTLADQIASADAVLVVTPEYNKGVSGVLKNALDWISRVDGSPWLNKPVAVMSAAAGRSGGERAQEMLRSCMNPFRARVLPGPELMLAQATAQFDENGVLTNERAMQTLELLMQDLRAVASS